MFTLGRSLDCDVSLNDPNISRVHAQISTDGTRCFIEDKGSSNGTFVNGTKIKPNMPKEFFSADQIKLGKSDFTLSVALDLGERTDPLIEKAENTEPIGNLAGNPVAKPQIPANRHDPDSLFEDLADQAPALNILNNARNDKVPSAKKTPVVNEPEKVVTAVKSETAEMAEKILNDAKKKAAKIVMEGEVEAEKAVQSIYEKARKDNVAMEARCKQLYEESKAKADRTAADAEAQGQELIREARRIAQELRNEVEVFISKTKAEALQEAEKIKVEVMQSSREIIRKENEDLLQEAQLKAAKVLDQAEEEHQVLMASYKTESSELESKLKILKDDLQRVQDQFEVEDKQLRKVQIEFGKLTEELDFNQKALKDTELKIVENKEELKKIKDILGTLQKKEAENTFFIEDLKKQGEEAKRQLDSDKALLSERLEKNKRELQKSEDELIEQMRVEMDRRLKNMERQVLNEIVHKKEEVIQEIHFAIEKELVLVVGSENWRKVSDTLGTKIIEAINDKVANLTSENMAATGPVKVSSTRNKEQVRLVATGLAFGMLLLFVGQLGFKNLTKQESPMNARVIAAEEARRKDLERRRFAPDQNSKIRASYTDSVIYTKNFVALYLDPEIQKRFYKEASQYLYKTWRTEEDKSIQLLSMGNALVKELSERRQKIHPDYVKDAIKKMNQFEKENLSRMQAILGSEVRLNSFKKFETKFYTDEMQRQPAQGSR